jgi:hypothetical protein
MVDGQDVPVSLQGICCLWYFGTQVVSLQLLDQEAMVKENTPDMIRRRDDGCNH